MTVNRVDVRFNDRVDRQARYPSTNRRWSTGLYYQVRVFRYVNTDQRKAIFEIRNRDREH